MPRSRILVPIIDRISPETAAEYYGPTDGAQAVRDGTGPRAVTLPGGGTDITVGNLTQANINSAGVGATLKIRAGTHRLSSVISFLEGQTVYAEDGATICGSAVVTDHSSSGWTADGAGRWSRTGQTQDFSAQSATILGSSSSSRNAVNSTELEDYYLDGVPMIAVTSSGAVTPGSNKKYMNRGGDTVWVGQDPADHLYERLVVNDHLVSTTNLNDITIIGGVWQHALYSCISLGYYHPTGALAAISGLILEDVECRYGHLRAAQLAASRDSGAPPLMTGNYVRYCNIHNGGRYNGNWNGNDGLTIEYTEFSYGNDLHFGSTNLNDEGGSKAIHSRNEVWQYNWSHNNDGPEWFDTNCSGTIQESVFEDAGNCSIMWEANDEEGLTVYRNHFKNNGIPPTGYSAWGDNAQLYISCSNPVDITRNIFESDAGVGLGSEQADLKYSWQSPSRPDVKNVTVEENLYNRSYTSGDGFFSDRGGSGDVFLAANNNTFDNNEYHGAAATSGRFFYPSGTTRTFAQWQAADSAPYNDTNDVNSTFTADL